MRFLLGVAAFALVAAPAAAQDKKTVETKVEKGAEGTIPPPKVVVTRHSGTFGGQRVSYTATIGETYLKDAKTGEPTAAIVSTAYVREGREPNRPVFFIFNGGPGSGSVWLHMGAWGPKRVVIPDAQDDGAPPYPIVDNTESLLDVADLVFIDPVGTGWSKALGKTEPKAFYGITKDARAVGEFIRIWLRENGRWNSPKFLGGESYGTTRAVAVAHELDGGYNDVAFNGIVLISTILDFSVAVTSPGNELGYVTALPSMAATAWYHNKVPDRPATLEQFVAQARSWAIGPYASALLQGNSLPADQRAQIRAQLARFTGLSEQFIENNDLRVSSDRFWKELLRDRGLVTGRLDTRYTGKDYDSGGESPDNDPSFYGIDASYAAAMNAYARGDLNFDIDRDYQSISGIGGEWDWNIGGPRGGNAYLNVAPWLGQSLRQNSGLRVFVGQGYYDFATPFFGAEYSLNRTGIPGGNRIEFQYYHAGHMMYVREDDLKKLSRDLRAFIRAR